MLAEDAPTEEVLVDVVDRVATVTLNRPDRLNALTATMGVEYARALRALDADPEVRAVVVTGAGRGFCSGADLSVLGQGPEALEGFLADSTGGDSPTLARDIDTPVVMAVQGAAAGLGFVIAMSGDVVFAGPEARFISAFSRLGLVAEYGIAWSLPRLVGGARAAEILLSGRPLDAEEAYRLGLVSAVVEDPLTAAREWAHDVAHSCSPFSTATMKRQLRASSVSTWDDAMTTSLRLMGESFRGPDLVEALTAKVQGRPPDFGG